MIQARTVFYTVFTAGLLGGLVGNAGEAAEAPEIDVRDCPPVCAGSCVKPIVVPDRWDDVTSVPGHPEWAGNGHYDRERFTDANGNGLFDPGEAFVDSDGNGRYDSEAYHPLLTGYVPDPVPGNVLAPEGDAGRLLTLHPAPGGQALADAYFAVSFPPVNKGTPVRGARAYREAFASCITVLIEGGDRLELEPGSMAGPTAEAVQAVYDQDPDARWDPVLGRVVGSRFDDGHQKRVVLLGLSDPRIPADAGRGTLQLRKIAAFFFEAPRGDGAVAGRFLKLRAPAQPCSCECQTAGAFLRHCP